MLAFVTGVFIALHGLVHLLYFGQSWRLFELQAGMVWPDGSWAFSRLLGNDATRLLASVSCILAAGGFVAGGAAILLKQAWWQPLVVSAAGFSTALYILFWDGGLQKVPDKGGIGLLINIAILASILMLKWPDFEF